MAKNSCLKSSNLSSFIACKDGQKEAIVGEIADLVYHLSVEMGIKEISWADVFEELKKR